MAFWNDKKVLVTGAYGFLGKNIVNLLREHGIKDLITDSHKKYDLTKEEQVKKLFSMNKEIDIVIHAAADVGGIGYSNKHPGEQFYNNAMMNILTLHYAFKNNIKKFVGVGSVCEYPEKASIPFTEKNVWNGYPVPSNDAYGFTKRMLLAQSISYRKEYAFNAIHLLPINLYGSGDDFNLETSHVIPALIRKMCEAIENNDREIVVWGSGKASREFLYVEDAARGIILAAEKYNKPEPVNIGTGFEIKIKDLVELIAELTGFQGKIKWDTTKPDGQLRRRLDVSRAKEEFGFEAKVDFRKGLKKTIEWYKNERKC